MVKESMMVYVLASIVLCDSDTSCITLPIASGMHMMWCSGALSTYPRVHPPRFNHMMIVL